MAPLSRRRFLGSMAAGALAAGFLPGPPARAVAIHPRSAWAEGRPPKGPLGGEEVRFLIVHHTASGNGHAPADAPAILRNVYDFHTGPDRGWNDIAYNFVIDSGGGIWEGRAGSLEGPVAGDATGGNQGFSQLVCLIGDYDVAQPVPASLRSLVSLLAWLADLYHIDTGPGAETTFTSRGSNRWAEGTLVTTPTIVGHRVMSQTSCPGENLNRYVSGELVADVSEARIGRVASTIASPPLAADAPPSIRADDVPPAATTTTTLPPRTPPPTRSPLLLGAGAVAALATSLAAWRSRRMSRD